MGFGLTQIINKVLNVQPVGSINKLFIPITATTTDQPIGFSFSTTKVLVINDGSDNLNFAFDGHSSLSGGTTNAYPYTDPSWTKTGTWGTGTYNGYDTTYVSSSAVTSNYVFKSPKSDLRSITWDMIQGQGAAIAKVELSMDNGVTWKSPSDITGVSRSDGSTGTAMNTFDQYTNVSTQFGSVTYNLSYNMNAIWAMRITPTATANLSAQPSPNIFIIDVKVTDGNGNIFTIKPKENLTLEIQTSQINISSPTTTTGRMIAI